MIVTISQPYSYSLTSFVSLLFSSSLRRGRNAGLVIKEQVWAEVDGDRVKEISKKWLKTKACSKRELTCSTWPAIYDDEWGQRKFYVYDKEGKMVAWVWWIPCWRDGNVVGYTASCLRMDSDKTLPCHNYVLNFAFLSCVEMFRAEGREFAALGGAYGTDIQKEKGDSSLIRVMGKWVYKHMSFVYDLKGLADHKDLYKANRVSKLYACHKGCYSMLIYLTMPYIATEAIPYLSVPLFGKGVFIHKHSNDQQIFLPLEDESSMCALPIPFTSPPSFSASTPNQDETAQQAKKPVWHPVKREGPKMTKRQRKRVAKQLRQQSETSKSDLF